MTITLEYVVNSSPHESPGSDNGKPEGRASQTVQLVVRIAESVGRYAVLTHKPVLG